MTAKKNLSLIDKVLAFLKLTEEGKVNNFFIREKRKFEREIVGLENNKKQLEFQFKQETSLLKDKIEDATQSLEESYLNVDIEKINTNESCDNFSEQYWRNIEDATDNLERLNKKVKEVEIDYNSKVEEIDKQIKERERRISKIS